MSDDRLYDFQLPDLGEGVVEGELVTWLVQPGQEVAADQPLVQVITDKATVEIPSPRKGSVKQLYFKEGDVVPVGSPMVQLELAPGEAPPPTMHQPPPSGGVNPPPTRPAPEAAKPAPPPSGGVSPAPSRPAAPVSAPLPSLGRGAPGARPAAAQPAGPPPPPPAPSPRPQAAPSPPAAPREAPAAVAARDGLSATALREAPERKPLATPAVRQLARDLGIDLAQIQGSGPAGRITREDVEAAARPQVPAAAPSPPVSAPPPAAAETPRPGAPAAVPAAPSPAITFAPGERERRIPVRGLRRKIAEKMVQSAFTAPHVTHVDEVDMTNLVALRSRVKEVAAERGIKLSYLPFVIKACVAALKRFPHFNASFDHENGEIVLKAYYHIGFGVATDQGLLVGVVKDADRKSILDLARETQDIAARVREGKASLDELTGGTFTVSNFGSLGGLFATPIINYPEVAILGLGKVQPRAVVRDEKVVPRDMMYLALSFDHRIVDGADGVYFANHIIKHLESPEMMLLDAV